MAINRMHKNLAKIVRVITEISSLTDRQTHTDVLILILRNRSHWQSNQLCCRNSQRQSQDNYTGNLTLNKKAGLGLKYHICRLFKISDSEPPFHAKI